MNQIVQSNSENKTNWKHCHHVQENTIVCTTSSFLIPLKFVDVVRRTHTTLDVVQECEIDDFWNVDGGRILSGQWTGCHPVDSIEQYTISRIHVVWEED